MGVSSVSGPDSSSYSNSASSAGGTGNAHNITVEECREMLNDPERSNISKEEFDQLSPDMQACYEQDPETGGYRLTQELLDVVEQHSQGGSNMVE